MARVQPRPRCCLSRYRTPAPHERSDESIQVPRVESAQSPQSATGSRGRKKEDHGPGLSELLKLLVCRSTQVTLPLHDAPVTFEDPLALVAL